MSLRRTLELLKTGERANDLLYRRTVDGAWTPRRLPRRTWLPARVMAIRPRRASAT